MRWFFFLTDGNEFSTDIFGEGVEDFEPCMGHGIKGPGKMLGLFINLGCLFALVLIVRPSFLWVGYATSF
ncbi:MAG: hypothetical protein ACE5G5_08055, partial [Candidatus Methylomirabilales bacterium]